MDETEQRSWRAALRHHALPMVVELAVGLTVVVMFPGAGAAMRAAWILVGVTALLAFWDTLAQHRISLSWSLALASVLLLGGLWLGRNLGSGGSTASPDGNSDTGIAVSPLEDKLLHLLARYEQQLGVTTLIVTDDGTVGRREDRPTPTGINLAGDMYGDPGRGKDAKYLLESLSPEYIRLIPETRFEASVVQLTNRATAYLNDHPGIVAIAISPPGPTPIEEAGCYAIPGGATLVTGSATGPTPNMWYANGIRGWISSFRWSDSSFDKGLPSGFMVSKACVTKPSVMTITWRGGGLPLTPGQPCTCFGPGHLIPSGVALECSCNDDKDCLNGDAGFAVVRGVCDLTGYLR